VCLFVNAAREGKVAALCQFSPLSRLAGQNSHTRILRLGPYNKFALSQKRRKLAALIMYRSRPRRPPADERKLKANKLGPLSLSLSHGVMHQVCDCFWLAWACVHAVLMLLVGAGVWRRDAEAANNHITPPKTNYAACFLKGLWNFLLWQLYQLPKSPKFKRKAQLRCKNRGWSHSAEYKFKKKTNFSQESN